MDNLKKSFKSLNIYEWIMAGIMIIIAASVMAKSFINPSDGGNPAWLDVINFISAVCGVFCIFFCARASISNFGFGLVNTVVYIIYLAYWKIYGTMCLEIFVYFPINIISWVLWAKHRDSGRKEITMAKRLKLWQDLVILAIVLLSACIYHNILVRIGGNVAWLDAFTVAIGIIATILEMYRYSEQYMLWIITDIVAVAMFIVHFDPVYLTKKSIYLVMAIAGLINWCRLN
ncbi:MAG: nicotinamide riboside transporter PnuC, partial [Lachnospiraceae bacterium]|nr:nicotinamide riboside transporter PnuC [Lachnospiraceae bacterium]